VYSWPQYTLVSGLSCFIWSMALCMSRAPPYACAWQWQAVVGHARVRLCLVHITCLKKAPAAAHEQRVPGEEDGGLGAARGCHIVQHVPAGVAWRVEDADVERACAGIVTMAMTRLRGQIDDGRGARQPAIPKCSSSPSCTRCDMPGQSSYADPYMASPAPYCCASWRLPPLWSPCCEAKDQSGHDTVSKSGKIRCCTQMF
jgi:hypothetical protein